MAAKSKARQHKPAPHVFVSVEHARTKLDLTKSAFGKRLGLTRQTVWRYENGDPVPKRVKLAITALLHEHEQRAR